MRKVDNPHAHLQEEGKGISFTASKLFAMCFLSQQHNSFYYKTYPGIESIDEMKKILQPNVGDTAGLRMILRQAVVMGYMDRLPDFPKEAFREIADGASSKKGDKIRFNSAEYTKLLAESRKQIKEAKINKENRRAGDWPNILNKRLYLHYFIILLANSGARTEEISGRLRHKDIRVVDKEKGKKLHRSPTTPLLMELSIK